MMRTTADLGWLLTDLLDTPGVLRAIVLTEDGMLTARSETLEQDEAERQAAASSSLWTLIGAGALVGVLGLWAELVGDHASDEGVPAFRREHEDRSRAVLAVAGGDPFAYGRDLHAARALTAV